MLSEVKESKNKCIILFKSCTSGRIECMKKNILSMCTGSEEIYLNNKIPISGDANLLHFDERSVYFE